MKGGPSQMDSFDPKPLLSRLDGQPIPPSFVTKDLDLQFVKVEDMKLLGSRRTFRPYGQSGLEISDLFSRLGQHADDLAVIRSCYHDSFIHGPAMSVMLTGSVRLGHPSVGAWVVYGLGSETENLPAYVAMSEGAGVSTKAVYGAGFLPAAYQGTFMRTEGNPLRNLTPPIDPGNQRKILDQVGRWNQRHLDQERQDDSRLAARLTNYELAFRMQTAAPELIDIAGELGRGCGSSAWIFTNLVAQSLVLSMNCVEAQDDVWGENPEALIASGLSVTGAKTEPVEGGILLDGLWSFSSGVDFADWPHLQVFVPREEGPPEPRFALIPRGSFEIVDDWNATGLLATGSKSVRLNDVFVPDYRTVAAGVLSGGKAELPLGPAIKLPGIGRIGFGARDLENDAGYAAGRLGLAPDRPCRPFHNRFGSRPSARHVCSERGQGRFPQRHHGVFGRKAPRAVGRTTDCRGVDRSRTRGECPGCPGRREYLPVINV